MVIASSLPLGGEGLRQARCKDVRRMQPKGYAWSDITEITGIHPEDLTEK